MKILWFSNCVLSRKESNGSGSWLYAMRDLICRDVELVNIAEDSVGGIQYNEGNGIKEYLIPNWRLRKGIPSNENIQKIIDVIKKEKPDLIHIWGVEKYWALLFSRGYIKYDKVLLEIQGVLTACTDVFWGGLSPNESKKIGNLWSIIYPKTRLSRILHIYQKNSRYEEEIIRYFKYISVQSKWTKEQLASICDDTTSFFYTLRPIRQEFYKADKWSKPKNENLVIFSTISYFIPFKGFHNLLRALGILVKHYPTITLRIAGPDITKRSFLSISDYERYILGLIKTLGIESNIHFCGSLKASQLIDEIHRADVVVNPSFVESYSAAAAESLYLGAPTVLSYAGAMVNFSDEKPVALYYNPMDYRSLAAKIKIMLEDDVIRDDCTHNSISILHKICSSENVRRRQLEIYNAINK